jgi:transcriptional regulator with XRE-family HTH domain/mannose-6-phosphate isomerase-like protein (cupin superfamily)
LRQQAYEDVGARLRAYRERAGIGVRELARRVGVSPSMVSQIETGKTQPSVSTLYAIVSVLAVSLDELFAPDDVLTSRDDGHGSRNDGHERVVAGEGTQLVVPPSVAEPGSPVQRASSRKAIRLAGGVRWDRLTAQHDREVDFLYVVYEPGADSSEAHTYMRHSGKEYGIVLKGQLAVAVGFEKYVLGPGDSISFDSTSPHRLWNSGAEPVNAIWVVIGRYAGPPQTASST